MKALQSTIAAVVPAVACCALLAWFSLSEAQTYYKWTDDNGTVHFTAEPPQDRDFETIDTRGNVIASTRNDPAAQAPTADDEAEPQMPREAAPDPEMIEARCTQARENLFWLESQRRIIVEDDQGNDRFIDPEEQQRLIEENRALIEQWCNGDGPN